MASRKFLEVSRLFDATPKEVYEAFLDPARAQFWFAWNPNDERTLASFEPRAGGRFAVQANGSSNGAWGVFRELEYSTRILFDHAEIVGADPNEVTVHFEGAGPATRLLLNQVWTGDALALNRARETWLARLDHLASFVNKSEPIIAIEEIATGVERVFAALADPRAMEYCLAADETRAVNCELDFREGGLIDYLVKMQDGTFVRYSGTFESIVRPWRVSMTKALVGPDGEDAKHIVVEDWPRTTLVIATIEGDEARSKLTIRQEPVAPTNEAREGFDVGREGATEYWRLVARRLGFFLTDF
ncbi:MAG: SRPBCC domain-containing protein [Fimbriimonadaceae bacterium]|nr:SRPBCC domain-containing protein [Fimbriimonadaceae bacterium]QYK54933.1 MAG: SRPBCC domain-containing protein [Fimbriimonadaceae bacterium]